MNAKDKIKQSKINAHETPLDETLYNQCSYDLDMDKQLTEKTLLGWIELIDNPKSYKALKDLPIEDQIFISYIVKECRTSKKLACDYNTPQQNISKKFSKVLDKLRHLIK